MPDLSSEERSSPVQVVGGGSSEETNIANVTNVKELSTVDTLNNGGLDKELTVTTTPVELKVGGTRKANRKYVVFSALDKGIKFGFSNTTQNIPIFKNQLLLMPCGENTQIWFVADNDSGKKIAIGEC